MPTVTGQRASLTTASGQQLFVTTLLPADAVVTAQPAPTEASGSPAHEQTMQDRLLVEAPGGPPPHYAGAFAGVNCGGA